MHRLFQLAAYLWPRLDLTGWLLLALRRQKHIKRDYVAYHFVQIHFQRPDSRQRAQISLMERPERVSGLSFDAPLKCYRLFFSLST